MRRNVYVPWRRILLLAVAIGLGWAVLMATLFSAPASSVVAWIVGTFIGAFGAAYLLKRFLRLS
jgi:hypothetical protein